METDQFIIRPGHVIRLKDIDPGNTGEFDGDKSDSKDRLDDLTDQLENLQELFYSQHKHALLIVLQGMDTAGKDGTIRHVFDNVNPQGVRVANFKAPTPQELSHDFLWRAHKETPQKGEVVIFNRSHYEDVLVVRVHNLVPEKTWEQRYTEINNFEHLLANEGTVILKFFLYISKKEQKERLLDRLKQPDKQWKFNPEDMKERGYWDDYIEAYDVMLNRTSTEWAPWYVVPADHKWYRNLVVANVLVNTLKNCIPSRLNQSMISRNTRRR